MSHPTFSVVMPAYEHESFVGEAVRSVLDQSFQDWELIVVDDGSTDGTVQAVLNAANGDARVRLVRQANGGSHAAINHGLSLAQGQWVGLLNSDDRWSPLRLQRAVDEAAKGARFITTGVRLIDAKGQVIADADHWWHRAQRDFRARALQWGPVDGLLHGNYTVSTSNFLVHRGLLEAVGSVRSLKMIPDWDWALRLAFHDPAGVCFMADEFLLDYRLHGGNTILQHSLRGNLEISRMHHRMLAGRQVPEPLVNAMLRNQRDLRQNWRRLGEERVERYLRDREADVQSLQTQLRSTTGALQSLRADVAQLRRELSDIRTSRSWRWLQRLRRVLLLNR